MVLSYDYPREPNDAYYEPAWCDDRLFEALHIPLGGRVWDPACGTGTIVEAAKRAGLRAIGTDLVQRWPNGTKDRACVDFLNPNEFIRKVNAAGIDPVAIVSNPPFKLAQEFAETALQHSPLVAFLLPTQWIQGSRRALWLETTPLAWFMPLVPRPSMPPVGSDVKVGGGKVDYAWFVWVRGFTAGTPVVKWLRK